MQRRKFLKRLGASTGLAAAPIAATAVAVQKNPQFHESTEQLKQRLKQAELKLDKLEIRHKKALKTGAIAAGLLIGFDLSLII